MIYKIINNIRRILYNIDPVISFSLYGILLAILSCIYNFPEENMRIIIYWFSAPFLFGGLLTIIIMWTLIGYIYDMKNIKIKKYILAIFLISHYTISILIFSDAYYSKTHDWRVIKEIFMGGGEWFIIITIIFYIIGQIFLIKKLFEKSEMMTPTGSPASRTGKTA